MSRLKSWYNQVYRFNKYNRDQWVTAQAARILAGQRVLDVGAGTGRYRSLFNHCDYRAHDFAQTPALEGKYTSLDHESDITAIPVPDESFDVILCTEVLEHVPEPIKAVHEMARILRLGGKLLLSAPLGCHLHLEPYIFYGGYTPYWYRKFLPEAGIEVESIETNQGFFSFFGQEALRFSALIDPRRTVHKGVLAWVGLTALWLISLPFARGLFPLLAGSLDQLGLERKVTVGYHVVGIKK